MNKMKITFLGAVKTVTGSKYLITVGKKHILVDCGLFQGYKELRLRNWSQLPLDPKQIDAVILTHAHIDHSGYLPLLVKMGFKGKIYCSKGTLDLCNILLPDSGYLQEEDAKRANKYGYSKHHPALPLYTLADAKESLTHFMPVEFQKAHEIFEDFSFKLYPAGHIIGSSLVEITHQNQTLLFTGDLGRPHHPIMDAPTMMTSANFLVVEATYGDRLHERSDPLQQLAETIRDTVTKGGSVIIPAFAVGRTQDLLYYLYTLKKENRIPDVPIFLDSPMAQNVSDLLIHHANEHRLSKEECRTICQTARYVKTAEESKAIDQYPVPVIIISASGMVEGGRILHHLKVFLTNPENTVILTGYQDPGTRGDRLQRGESEIKIHGQMIPVRAKIVAMNSLSAHADYEEMLDWLKHFKSPPKKVFITHGDEVSCLSLKAKIEKRFGWKCIVPDYMQTEELK